MYIQESQVFAFQGASVFMSTSGCRVEWTQSQGHASWIHDVHVFSIDEKNHVQFTVKCSMPGPCLPMAALEEGLADLEILGNVAGEKVLLLLSLLVSGVFQLVQSDLGKGSHINHAAQNAAMIAGSCDHV